MSDMKWVSIANAVMTISGCACVFGATYITKNPNCLWALIIVTSIGMNYKSKAN